MRARTIVLVGLAGLLLGGYIVVAQLLDRLARPSGIPAEPAAPAAAPSSSTAALSGVWESAAPGQPAIRLVVEEVQSDSAVILFAWGNHPMKGTTSGWMRAHAQVLPDRRLHLAYPLVLTFTLSDDGTALLAAKGDTPDLLPSIALGRVGAKATPTRLVPLPESR